VEVAVIDSILNLLFRCAHQRLTRPFSPVSVHGDSQGEAYVVCLDCGKQFTYDLRAMRVGRPIDRSHDASVLPPSIPAPRKKKLKYAMWAAVPVAVAVSVALNKKSKRDGNSGTGEEPGEAAPGKPGEGGPDPQ
jgi:hypothetical protein